MFWDLIGGPTGERVGEERATRKLGLQVIAPVRSRESDVFTVVSADKAKRRLDFPSFFFFFLEIVCIFYKLFKSLFNKYYYILLF